MIVSAEGLQSCLNLLILLLFFLDKVLILAHSILQTLLFLYVCSLNTNGILVELILSQEIASYAFVQSFDLFLLFTDLIVQAIVELEDFLKLKLEECMLMDMRCINTNLTISINDI